MLLPEASVNVDPSTSIVTAPSVVGVNVAVYTVEDTAVNVPKEPLLTVISPTAKFDVASLDVNVSESVELFDVNPSEPSAAVIVMVGDN